MENSKLLVYVCCVLTEFSHVQLCNHMDCSPLGSPDNGILQARILEWVAICSSTGSSLTQGSNPCPFTSPGLAGRFFTTNSMVKAFLYHTNSFMCYFETRFYSFEMPQQVTQTLISHFILKLNNYFYLSTGTLHSSRIFCSHFYNFCLNRYFNYHSGNTNVYEDIEKVATPTHLCVGLNFLLDFLKLVIIFPKL